MHRRRLTVVFNEFPTTPNQEQAVICIPTNRSPLGNIIVTPAAARAMKDAKEMPAMFLAQHLEDKFPDGEAVSDGRLMSAYLTSNGVILWIITEPDRSATTILLPEDS